MTEWQGAVLRAQLERFPAQQAVRSANADFLNAALAELPGITPQARHSGCTSQGYYDYLVKFDRETFPDRDKVITALIAEGMPLTTGYPPMHQLEMFSREGGLGPRLRDTTAIPPTRASISPSPRSSPKQPSGSRRRRYGEPRRYPERP